MFRFNDALHEDETIVFPAKDTGQVARSTFRRCVIEGHTAGSFLAVSDSSFEHCEIRWKTPLKNMIWNRAQFSNCIFYGRYIGNRFGHPDKWESDCGSMIDCDLTKAHLHGTDFVNCDMARIKVPSWPYFTLLTPSKNQQYFLEAVPAVLPELRPILQTSKHAYPETSAIVWSATEVAKEAGVTDAEVLESLQRLPADVYRV